MKSKSPLEVLREKAEETEEYSEKVKKIINYHHESADWGIDDITLTSEESETIVNIFEGFSEIFSLICKILKGDK